jgi:ABC-type multidrug transport system fused ATPase/permease subunit
VVNVPIRRYWALLDEYLAAQRWRVAWLAALVLGGVGLQLAIPQIMGYFIDAARAGSPLEHLLVVGLVFLGVAAVRYVLTIGTAYLGEDIGWTATNGLRADLAAHCLRLDMSFHNARTPGELIERVDGDVSTLAGFFSQMFVQMAANLLLLAGILLVLALVDWRLAAAYLLFVVVALVIMARMRGLAVPRMRATRQASAELSGFLEERLAGTEDLRTNGGTAYTMRRLYERMRDYWRKDVLGEVTFVTFRNVTAVLGILSTVLGLGLGSYLFLNGTVTIGTVFLIYYYNGVLLARLQGITQELQNLQGASASILRVDELVRTQSAIADGRLSLPGGPLAVEFDAVSFAYPEADEGREASPERSDGTRGESRSTDGVASSVVHRSSPRPVLRDVSFRLEPGTVLGLLGRTGSGKTTVGRLLFRMYDPTAGAVRLGGIDVRAARLSELRRRVGMVTQEVQLFSGSVRDNLTFFDRRIQDGRILAAISALGLEEWYGSLREGLDTPLAGGGGDLSAGEAQLLALTRVFLKDPGLIVLDEASSRLDPATERLIEGAIDRLLGGEDSGRGTRPSASGGGTGEGGDRPAARGSGREGRGDQPSAMTRTAIVIAHRLSTVRHADEIMVLQGGRVVEHGARSALAADPASAFARLLRTGVETVDLDETEVRQGAPSAPLRIGPEPHEAVR